MKPPLRFVAEANTNEPPNDVDCMPSLRFASEYPFSLALDIGSERPHSLVSIR
jgi:hypothetical protein